jgi:hypothetical protein
LNVIEADDVLTLGLLLTYVFDQFRVFGARVMSSPPSRNRPGRDLFDTRLLLPPSTDVGRAAVNHQVAARALLEVVTKPTVENNIAVQAASSVGALLGVRVIGVLPDLSSGGDSLHVLAIPDLN